MGVFTVAHDVNPLYFGKTVEAPISYQFGMSSLVVEPVPDARGYRWVYGVFRSAREGGRFEQNVLMLDESTAGKLRATIAHRQVELSWEDEARWQEFYSTKADEVISLLIRFYYRLPYEDLFWIEVINGWCHHLELLWDEAGMIGVGRHQAIPDRQYRITADYYDPENMAGEGRREQQAKALFSRLTDTRLGLGLSATFPMLGTQGASYGRRASRMLVVKFGKEALPWRLIPFEGFAECGLGQFGCYSRISYIVSDKGFLQHFLEHGEIEFEINQYDLFLNHSIIIVNDYSHFRDNDDTRQLCEQGFELIRKLETIYRSLPFTSGHLTLPFLLHADAGAILKELANKDRWFVFANFHTVNGEWTVGDNEDAEFYRNVLAMDLSHIKWLRVFHCNSNLNSTYGPGIVSALLDRGAVIVEGSNQKESFLTYLFSLVYLFTRSGLDEFIRDRNKALLEEAERFLADIQQFKPELYAYK